MAEVVDLCLSCSGTGKTRAWGCGGGTGRWVDLTCHNCAGVGTITPERQHELNAAALMREDRKRRGLTGSQEAARLGMTPQAYSKLEHP